MDNIRAFNFKVNTVLPDNTYRKLPHAFPSLRNLASLYQLQSCMGLLSHVYPRLYDCCVDSCMCYTGKYGSLDACPYCCQPRYNSKGASRRTFKYVPLLPRLISLFQNGSLSLKLGYRANYDHIPGQCSDIFDGDHYQGLRKTRVTIDNEPLPHWFFSDSRDIALGLSFDGFGPFKRRKHTCWPIVLFNYNLPPEERFLLANIICVGIIPGPKQMKDADSFLFPLMEELLKAARGLRAYDTATDQVFAFHAYLILVFGDMPAVAKLMKMKGHNSISPCRACSILGISCANLNSNTHYTPLHRHNLPSYDPAKLPIRLHHEFLQQAQEVESQATKVARDDLSKLFGINGTPILSRLSSLSFPASFPFDFMHLIWENVTKTLVDLWCGDFKGIDEGTGEYTVASAVWEAIGTLCRASGDTIPAVFSARVPNIATERSHFIAETWGTWTLFLGPVLLRKRFRRDVYHKHFVSLVKLLSICLQFNLTSADIDKVELGMRKWVLEYEK